MSKGSARRPGHMPDANWDAIFKPAPPPPFCNLCKMPANTCGCVPTDDGPGQGGACQCSACAAGRPHDSDCAVHNMPATANGPCDCAVEAKAQYERRRFERN